MLKKKGVPYLTLHRFLIIVLSLLLVQMLALLFHQVSIL